MTDAVGVECGTGRHSGVMIRKEIMIQGEKTLHFVGKSLSLTKQSILMKKYPCLTWKYNE